MPSCPFAVVLLGLTPAGTAPDSIFSSGAKCAFLPRTRSSAICCLLLLYLPVIAAAGSGLVVLLLGRWGLGPRDHSNFDTVEL